MGFRPLAGIRVFRTHIPADLMNTIGPGFRPLAGIRVFRTGTAVAAPRAIPLVSVPWRGLGSFGLSGKNGDWYAILEFPSPGGD